MLTEKKPPVARKAAAERATLNNRAGAPQFRRFNS